MCSIADLKENKYHVTPEGRILDLVTQKWRNPSRMKNGTYNITMKTQDGSWKTYLMNSLVYEWHTGHRVDRHEVIIHVDGDPANHAISNLKCISRLELSHHYFTFRQPNWITCPQCGGEAPRSGKWSYHLKICDGSRPFKNSQSKYKKPTT